MDNLLSQARHSLTHSQALTVGVGFVLLLGFLLGACGESPTASGSYIYTDSTQVELLTWQSGNNGQLTGQWNGVSYQRPLASNSQPSVSQPVSLTGTETNGTVQLSGQMFSFQGTVSGSSLKIRTSNASSGQVVGQTWVSASQQDYNGLVTAFNTSMHLTGAITDMNDEVLFPTDDSNPATLNNTVKVAQQYVMLLQGKVASAQEAPSHPTQCQQLDLLSQYYPAAPETFQLPYQPGDSKLAKDLATIASLWKQAQRQTIHIDGINPPWTFTQAKLNSAVTPGQKAYTNLQSTYQDDQKKMSQSQKDYQSAGKTISSLKQTCP